MRRFCIAILFSVISVHGILAQNVAATQVNTRDSNPGKKYLRPSLTVLFAERGNDRSKRMMQIVNASPVPGKFNDHNVSIRSIKVNGENIRPVLTEALNDEVSRQIVAKWFNRNAKGEFSMDLIGERGLYSATDADVLKAKASQRKMDLLRDAGENLLDRSYIVVYDVKNIITAQEYDSRRGLPAEREGYIATYDCYLYKLDWNDSVASVFYNNLWNDASNYSSDKASMFDKTKFPVKYITYVSTEFGTVSSTQFKDHSRNIFGSLSDEELFAGIWSDILRETDISLAKVNEDFKVKTPVFSTRPIAAKIGLKEGLSTDRRFFVYEFELDDNGNKIAKRKAVVRVGSHISDNRRLASGKSDTSTFYQVAGRRVYEGMLLQEYPDWGIGVTLGFGSEADAIGEGLNATVEVSLAMWAGKTGLSLPTGLKAYGTYAMRLSDIEIVNPLGDGVNEKYSSFSWAAGLSKDLYFFRGFVLVPFAGYGQESYANTESSKDKDKYVSEFIQGGARLGINIVHNVQLMGNAYYSTIIGTDKQKGNETSEDDIKIISEMIKDSRKNVQYSAGIRILF